MHAGQLLMRLDAGGGDLATRSIYASIDGVVRTINASDIIDSGEAVASLVPDGGEPTAIAFIPIAGAERIEPGMTLQLSIAGYDRLRIAVTEVERGASFARVKAHLPGPTFESDGVTYKLWDGQTGRAEIEVESRSLLSVALAD